MGFFDALGHLLNFVLPALAVSALAALLAKLLWWRELRSVSWLQLTGPATVAGALVLVVGLVLGGRDGRMLTYLGLVFVTAVALWWAGFGPGRRR